MNAISSYVDRCIADPSIMPPDLLEALLEDYRRELTGSLLPWCKHVLAPVGHAPARHHELIIDALQDVADGNCDRLMIFLPPGSAKSTYASVLFPPWFMSRKKGMDVVAASHTVGLAERFGRQARDIVAEHGATLGAALQGDNTAAGSWRMQNGSRYYAVGVGGSLTGRRADVIVVDDPVKEDESDLTRDSTWDWYNSVLLTRLKPGGRIVLVMTRWHQDDLAGRLLATEPDRWKVLKVPALAEDEDDPLGRAMGEPLWADDDYGFGAELERKRDGYAAAGAMRVWSALYQQRPAPDGGALFKVAKIGAVDALPAGGKMVRGWDLAGTKQTGTRDPDWTVGLLLVQLPSGSLCVADVVRFRGGPDEVEQIIVATAQRDGRAVRISLPQDPGQAGKSQILYLTQKLAGFVVESSPETGDKATRAGPVASQANVGNLSMVRADWNKRFVDELQDFPAGAKDDQVDALSRAFNTLTAAPAPARVARVVGL